MSERKQINFTIVPEETGREPRVYANFCSLAHTPFDLTLTFCEVLPLTERDVREAEATQIVKAPVKAKVVLPLQVVPNLIAALQDQMRAFSEAAPGADWSKGPVH